MVAYRDFVPTAAKGKWYQGATYASFDSAVEAANEWLRAEKINVLHVETVVLPNIYETGESGSADGSITTASGWAYWHQFVRVWYRRS